MKNYNILIIGGSGFIGTHLVHSALEKGWNVTICDLQPSDIIINSYDKSHMKFIQRNINDKSFSDLIVQDKDFIVNLAVKHINNDNSKDIQEGFSQSIYPALNILESSRKYNRKAIHLFLSSRLVYGNPIYLTVDEKHPICPLNEYGVHKMITENIYMQYKEDWDIKSVILRVADVYGPRKLYNSDHLGAINTFIKNSIEHKASILHGDGVIKRDYIFVSDICEAITNSLLNYSSNNTIFNVGSGLGISLLQIIQEIGTFLNKEIDYELSGESNKLYFSYITDIQQIHSVNGWEPKTNFTNGLRETLFDCQNQLLTNESCLTIG